MINAVLLPSNKKFGLSFSFIFFAFSIFFFIKNIFLISYIFIFLAIALVPISVFSPNYLSNFNRMWMTFGLLLSKIMNPFILGIIFFGLITPVGLFRKLIGKDELKLNKDSRQTYWHIKDQSITDTNSFKDQF